MLAPPITPFLGPIRRCWVAPSSLPSVRATPLMPSVPDSLVAALYCAVGVLPLPIVDHNGIFV